MTQLPRNVDVAIVGGGFAGMSTAWWLARRGVRDVIVLEREIELGRYASGRSAGLGRQLAEDDVLTALTVAGARHLRTHVSQAWSATGGLLTFDSIDHARSYEARATRMGVAAQRLDRAQVLGYWPQLAAVDIAAGLHVPSDGIIDVRALLACFADGIRTSLDTAVERIAGADRGATLLTSRGTCNARVVVDATGAWAGRATGDALLDSYKRHVYVLEAAAPSGAPFVWHLGSCELYVRAVGGQILVSPCDGTKVDPGDQEPDAAGERLLRARLEGSSIAVAQVARAWACQRAFAPRTGMRLARDAERPWLVWAAGLGGHGATAAGAVGETVAELVVSALDEQR